MYTSIPNGYTGTQVQMYFCRLAWKMEIRGNMGVIFEIGHFGDNWSPGVQNMIWLHYNVILCFTRHLLFSLFFNIVGNEKMSKKALK